MTLPHGKSPNGMCVTLLNIHTYKYGLFFLIFLTNVLYNIWL